MAKIQAVLDKLDGVDESIREFYTEENGSFVLQIDQFAKHPGVATLKKAADAHKRDKEAMAAERDALKARVEGLPEDFDAEHYTALKAQAEGKGGVATDDQLNAAREKVRLTLEKKFGAQLAERDAKIEKLTGSVQKMTVDEGLLKAMDAANIEGKHKAKLIPYLKGAGKIEVKETENGTFQAVVETDMGSVDLTRFVADWAGSDDGKPYVATSTGPDARGGKAGGGAGEKTIARSKFDALDPGAKMQSVKDGLKVVDD